MVNSAPLRVFPISWPEERRAVNAFIPLPEPAEDVSVAPNRFVVRAGLWKQPQPPFPSSQIAVHVTTSPPFSLRDIAWTQRHLCCAGTCWPVTSDTDFSWLIWCFGRALLSFLCFSKLNPSPGLQRLQLIHFAAYQERQSNDGIVMSLS